MEEAKEIGCITCFTGNSRSKSQPNHLLIESVSSKLELLPCYEKLPHDPTCDIIPQKMPQDQGIGDGKRSKRNVLGTNSDSGIDVEREEGGDKVKKRSSWLPNANGKRWPVQGWA